MGLRFQLTTDRQKLARPLPHVAAGRNCRGANISQLQCWPLIQEAAAGGAGATAASFF